MGVLAPGIGALGDGHGLVKALPKPAVLDLPLVREGKMQLVHRKDAGAPLGVQQNLPVGAVVNEKGLVGVAAAKMTAQQGQDLVFRFDLAA